MDLITKLKYLKKKRGRKSKKDLLKISEIEQELKEKNIDLNILSPNQNNNKIKKRGRKPKGGKVLKQNIINDNNNNKNLPNILLHLKCKTKDLENNIHYNENLKYEPTISSVKPFNCFDDNILHINNTNLKNQNNNLIYEEIKHTKNQNNNINNKEKILDIFVNDKNSDYEKKIISTNINDNIQDNNKRNINKENNNNQNCIDINKINNKLEKINENLILLDEFDEKSSCFWDGCSFNHQSVHIPKYILNGIYFCYGCFCSPECAAAYLFKEKIDESMIWERYMLLHQLYSQTYGYKENIKLAPQPFYLLKNYYGTLTIEEYRALINSNQDIYFIEKPITKIFPEMINIQNSNEYSLKQHKYKLFRNKEPINKNKLNKQIWNN